ncbi:MAG TPA: DegV family protein [Clostridiales bacterium]|nr:DegV family protein [Clostridiales bacterium]
MKTAILTDGNSGISLAEAKELGVTVIPTSVIINGEVFFEDVTLTQEQFYEKLTGDAQVSTSQPSIGSLIDTWDELLKTYDELVYIPISTGLGQNFNTANQLAQTEERFKGKVFVIDNQRVSITQKQSVLDALKMASEGKSGKEIAEWLTATKMKSSIYIMVGTLKYLKKGGRLTPAVAAIGTLLKIKPVLQIQGDKLDNFAKVRKLSDAKNTMINALNKDLTTRFAAERKAGKMTICIAHTQNLAEAEKFREELIEQFPDVEFTCIAPLSLSVSCHIGPGALACASVIKY